MKNKPLWLKWLLCLTPLFVAALMYFLLPLFPNFTEYIITRGLFRIVSFPFGFLMSLIPFSVAEVLVVLLIPAIFVLLTVLIIRLFKKGHPAKTAERGARFTAFVLSAVLLVFMINDGGNFSRIPLGELMELPERQYTAEELYAVTVDLAEKTTQAREDLKQDRNGCTVLTVSKKEILKLADDSYDNIAKEYKFLKTGVTRAKGVKLSHQMSYTGTTGVYCPWTLEANVNTDVPVSDIPSTAAHEIAHTMGFAKEDECNFLAYLACITSGQADYVYSGYLSALIYCGNALYKADSELFQKAVTECSLGVYRDLKQKADYWSGFEGEVMESSEEFNDTFIKVNGVESGSLSYGEMVKLVLRYYDSNGFFE